MQFFVGKIVAALNVRSKSGVLQPVVVLTALKPVSEVLNVVDQDKLLLGASVHKVPEDNVATRVHAHVSKCVLRETRLNQAGGQFSLLF